MPLSVGGELTLAEALALWQTGPSSREQCEAELGAVFHHAAPLCFCSSSCSLTAVSAQERVSEASEGAAAVAQAAAASIALSGQSARDVTVEACADAPTAEPSASFVGVASTVQLPAAQSASKKKCDIVEVAASALSPVKAAWPASPPHSPCTTFTEAAVVSDRAFDCAVARAEAAFAAIGRLRPDEKEGAQAEALAAAAAQLQAEADAAADAEIDRADAEARARFEAAKAAVRAQADAANRLAAEQQAAAQATAQVQAEADARVRDAADAAAADHLAAQQAAAEKAATAAAAAAIAAKAKADADAKASADKLSAEHAVAARAEAAARASQDAANTRAAADARAEKEAAGKARATAEAQALADAVATLRADADAKAKAEQASGAAAASAAAEVAAAQAQASAQQRAGEQTSLAAAQASAAAAAAAAALHPARLMLSPPHEPLPADEMAAPSPSRVYVNAVFESSEEQPRALPPAPRRMVANAEEIAGALLRLLPDHHRCAELLLPLPAQLSGGVLASSLLSEAESAAIMHAMQARRRGWQPASRSEDAAVCAQDEVPSTSEEPFPVAQPVMATPEASVPLLEEEQLAPPVAPAAADEPLAVGAAPCTPEEAATHLEAEECPTLTPTRAPPRPDSPPAQPSPRDPLPPPPALELAASACVDPLTPRSPDAPDESDEVLAPARPAPVPARGPPQAHALSLLTADEVAAALAGQPRCGELLMALPPALASAALASTVLEEGAGVAMMHAYLEARSGVAGGAVTAPAPLRPRGEEGVAEGRKESQSTAPAKQRTPQKLKHVRAHAPAPAASPWTGADAGGREGDLSWRQVVDVSRAAAAAIDAQPLDAAPAGAPPSPAQRRGWVRAALGAGAGLLGAALLAAGGHRGRPRTAVIPPTPLDSGTPPSARGAPTPRAATPVRQRETEAALVAPPFLFYDPDAGRPLTPGKYKP